MREHLKPGRHCEPVSGQRNQPGRVQPPPGMQVLPAGQTRPSHRISRLGTQVPVGSHRLPSGQSLLLKHLFGSEPGRVLGAMGSHREPPATHFSNGPQERPPPQ